jgi:ribonuclease D
MTEAGPARADPGQTDDIWLVATPDDLAHLADHLRRSSQVALDIEANSLHAYRERTCVLQVTAEGRHAIIDAVALEDLSPLRDAFDRDDLEVLFHGGDYDIAMLSRDHGFAFHRVFDTMIAATLLGEEKVGLANLVLDAYGVQLDKRYQKADWARRPLTADQIDYLYRDTAYLPGLWADLHARLEDADLEEEAAIEFRRLASRVGKHAEPDPDAWRRIKGSSKLDAVGRAVLAELHAWREGEASQRDTPPFKILSPRTLLALAEKPPTDARDPGQLTALRPKERARWGAGVLAALRRGLQVADDGHAPPRDVKPRLTQEEAARRKREKIREEALRDWRRKEAAGRKVPNLVVLPNRAMAWIAREVPRTVASLAEHEDIGAKRAARYGETILSILESSDRKAGPRRDA